MLRLCSATIWLVILAPWAIADDWTSKTIQPKQAVKLGRKFGSSIHATSQRCRKQRTHPIANERRSTPNSEGGAAVVLAQS